MRIAARIAGVALSAFVMLTLGIGATRASPLSDGVSAFHRGDYLNAARKLAPLAERGNAEAQTLLGFMYQYGRGVPQNAVIAVHWYECAAVQGDAHGQYFLGLMYDKGHGVPRSAVIAYKWLNLAAAGAHPKEREYYLRIRDAVATKLNNAQLAEGQALSVGWVPVPVRP